MALENELKSKADKGYRLSGGTPWQSILHEQTKRYPVILVLDKGLLPCFTGFDKG